MRPYTGSKSRSRVAQFGSPLCRQTPGCGGAAFTSPRRRPVEARPSELALHGLIPAAGNGFRFGSDMPKQYLSLHGRPVLLHSIERLRRHFDLTSMSVVIAHDDHWFEEKIGTRADVTLLRCGGATRAESVRNALDHLGGIASPDDWIIGDDAVRPCIDHAASRRLREELADDPVDDAVAVETERDKDH